MGRLQDFVGLLVISFTLVFSTEQILIAKTIGQDIKESNANSVINTANTFNIKGSDKDSLGKDTNISTGASVLSESKEDSATDEEENMEESLELLNSSRSSWEKGDIENALDLLDQAYALLLSTNGNPDIARQKDDLRLLIAKNILAIYTSMQTATNGKRGEIPLVMNDDVQKEIQSFQNGEKDFFVQAYQKSGIYRPAILAELKKAGLPEELSWLPLVESGFKVCALSRARALGLWQFIPSTGYKYGLNRDEWIDERMDIEKSTRAAISYLKELHGMFGDWLTVLAAYNCGEGRVLKVISGQHLNYLDRFWDLYHQLPCETARYVPRFLATLHIIKNPKKYGFNLETESSGKIPPYEIVKATKSMKLQEIAAHIDIPEDALNILNSELRYKITPDREYNLKVPEQLGDKFYSVVDEIPRCEKPQTKISSYKRKSTTLAYNRVKKSKTLVHRVRKGETLTSIAQKYGTSVISIKAYNRSLRKNRILVGQRLIMPVRGYKEKYAKAEDVPYKGDKIIRYKIKRGDTLREIARKFNTTINDIKKLNNIEENNSIKFGQIIRIKNQQSG